MEAKLAELIAQAKGDASLATKLDESSHLVNDAGLDSLELINLILLVEREFGVTVDFDSFSVTHLSSVANFATYIRELPKA